MDIISQPEFLCLFLFVFSCGLLLLGFPVAFTLAGSALMVVGLGFILGVFDSSLISAFPQRVFAVMSNELLVAVPLFVFMGVMLERSNIAEELLDSMGKLFGSVRGGLGYSVCIVGALLAASTGIVGATVVTMGLLSLPTMIRRGYDPALACGTICASGTLGQIIPPSIVLILLGDQLSVAYQRAQFEQGNFAPDTVSVNDLFAGALIPGLVLVVMYLIYQALVAWLRPESSPAIPRDELIQENRWQFYKKLLSVLVAPILLIVAVLGSILGGLASPTESASIGAAGGILLAGYRLSKNMSRVIFVGALCMGLLLLLTNYFDLRISRDDSITDAEWIAIYAAFLCAFGLMIGLALAIVGCYSRKDNDGERVLVGVMRSTMKISSMVFVILAGAAMFSLAFRDFGGDEFIAEYLQDLPGGTMGAVVVVMLVMFLLGFFLDFLEIVFIVVPIVTPVLLQMEMAPGELMNPVWLGVMMAMILQTSFLTPPFGFSLFYLRGVAPGTIKTSQIYRGVMPFVSLQLLSLVVFWYWPDLTTWLPELLYER